MGDVIDGEALEAGKRLLEAGRLVGVNTIAASAERLPVLLFSTSRGLPNTVMPTRESLTQWIADAGIQGTVEPGQYGHGVQVVPAGPQDALHLAELLLAHGSKAREAAQLLATALSAREIGATATPDYAGDGIRVIFDSDRAWEELAAGPVRLALILGGQAAIEGLRLHKWRGREDLIKRLSLLVNGAVGLWTHLRHERGSEHCEGDAVDMLLSSSQAGRLVARMNLGPDFRPFDGVAVPVSGSLHT